MTGRILVTGGTGTLGRHVLPLLREAGAPLRVLSRHPHQGDAEYAVGDLLTGKGIDAAVEDCDVVLHLAGGPKGDDEATRTLLASAKRAGVRHLVYISIINADRIPIGYYRAKVAAEQAITASGLPWTTLRAAQFHDLIGLVAGKLAASPLVPVPGGFRFQPVDAGEVAARLIELALGEPSGLVRDLAGPQVLTARELFSAYLGARGKRRMLVPLRVPGRLGHAYRSGENINLDADRATRTFADYLAAQS